MNTAKIQQLLDAVPDIGDQRAREVTIARMAYEAGQAAERERCLGAALAEIGDGGENLPYRIAAAIQGPNEICAPNGVQLGKD